MSVITNDSLKSTIALAALQQVMDPEIQFNVVDLGLIYQVDFEETEQLLWCTMTLTTSFCPMGATLVNSVKETLQQFFPEYAIKITVTFDQPWSPEKISESGRLFLNER